VNDARITKTIAATTTAAALIVYCWGGLSAMLVFLQFALLQTPGTDRILAIGSILMGFLGISSGLITPAFAFILA